MANSASKTSFTISLPSQALVLMKKLEKQGLYGTNRGEISRQLILDQLKYLQTRGVFEET